MRRHLFARARAFSARGLLLSVLVMALFSPPPVWPSFVAGEGDRTAGTKLEPLPLPAGSRLVTETQSFRFVSTPKTEGLARSLAESAEYLRARIATDLGRDYQGVTEVRVADGAGSFQDLQPLERGAPSWAVGIAWPSLNVIVLNSGNGRTPSEIRRTLAHEVSHIALVRLAPRSFPRWFLEGMAMYHSEEWSFSRAGSLAGAVLRDGLIPLQDLGPSWPDTPVEVKLAYAQSNDFVAWLFRNHGRDAVHRLISEVVEGRPFDEAIELGTGIPMWKLEYEWREGLPFRYTWLPVITSGSFVWGLMSLLFILAYLRKRHSKQQRMAAMEEEELWIAERDDSEEVLSRDDPAPLVH